MSGFRKVKTNDELKKKAANGEKRGIIKNISIVDLKQSVSNISITTKVIDKIYEFLDERGAPRLFNKSALIKVDSRIALQTDPVKVGTFFDTVLNLNKSFLGGKTVEEIDEIFLASKSTVANSLREALIHEEYHARLIQNLNYSQLTALYDELSYVQIDGISYDAYKDGSECIAEVGVLIERGEIDSIPQLALDLFNKYFGGKV